MRDLLTVENLHTQFRTREGTVRAVDGVSFSVDDGETVGIVGESGCGKSVTARSIVGLQDPGEIVAGSIRLDGTNVPEATDRQLRKLRGDTVSMVFQDPTQTLNPVFDVGEQIAESLSVHDDPDSQRLLDYLHAPLFSRRSKWEDHRERAVDLMEQVGIASPEDRVDAYPHELSGGMRQRAGLAIALASDPDLLIADEPTTALDTTTQAQILARLRRLSDDRGMALLLITHDLGVVADICDRVVVMYGGQVMETGPTDRVLEDPRHPYTRALLECLTRTTERKQRLPTIEGTVPERVGEQSGCPFASRCPSATDACLSGEIPTVDLADGSATCGESIVFDPSERAAGGADDSLESATPVASASTTAGTSAVSAAAESVPTDRSQSRPGGTSADARLGPSDSNASSAPAGDQPVVALEGVSKRFSLDDGVFDRVFGRTRDLQAVDDVSLEIGAGETLGLVGESGSGKSTLANLVTGLEAPTSGEVRLDGVPVGPAGDRSPDTLADIGVVFQNPHSSLNPRMTVERTIAEPLRARGWDEGRRRERVSHLLEVVGLSERYASQYPHGLSGGQIQRVCDRAGDRPRPEVGRSRRTRLRARRFGTGSYSQPVVGPPARSRVDVSRHLPRSGRDRARCGSDRRPVSRRTDGGRSRRSGVRAAGPSLHSGAARGDSVARRQRVGIGRLRGPDPESPRRAEWLSVPHAVSGRRTEMCRRPSGLDSSRTGPIEVSLSARAVTGEGDGVHSAPIRPTRRPSPTLRNRFPPR